MEKEKILSLVKNGIVVVLSAFGFLACLFNYFDYHMSFFGTTVDSTLSGYSVFEGYPAAIESVGGWLTVYSIIYLVITAILTGVSCYKLYKQSDLDKFGNLVCVISVILALIYLINGSVAKSTLLEGDTYNMGTCTTGAFWPLIITIAVSLIFFAIKKLVKNK